MDENVRLSEQQEVVDAWDAVYQRMLDSDPHSVPESYRRHSPMGPGPTLVPINRYITKEFHDLEVEKVWKRVWQMACHEDDIPNVGDSIPYDIAGMSFLIVRSAPDRIKAYYNACLHRGRKLRETPGKGAAEIRCQFHAWTWNLEGELKQVPCRWDFPAMNLEEQSLPEAKVGVWGRFVFINPDLNCEPLEDFIGDLSSHFEVLPYERLYKEVHVSKIIRANWKVTAEAFMESYHVIATHPAAIAGGTEQPEGKYDVFGNYSRAIRVGVPEGSTLPDWSDLPAGNMTTRVRHPLSGWLYERIDENISGKSLVRVTTPKGKVGIYTSDARCVEGDLGDASKALCGWVGGIHLPEEISNQWNTEAVKVQREAFRPIIPSLIDQIANVEFDAVFFTLFPNFHPWGSFNKIIYRFRPNGNNYEETIMDVMLLAPIPENGIYETSPEIHHLGPDDDWTDAPELGLLTKVFNQDSGNLQYVQEGMHAMQRDYLQLADYNETKVRHFHDLLTKWTERP